MSFSFGAALKSGFQHAVTRQWQSTNTSLTPHNLIYPLFISDDPDGLEHIASLPGQARVGINNLEKVVKPLVDKGLSSVLVFGVISKLEKDGNASNADSDLCPTILGIKKLHSLFPDLLIICDVCLCPFTDHGHCEVMFTGNKIYSSESCDRTANVSKFSAFVGCHVVAPSDMMDNRVAAIKQIMAANGYGSKVAVLSYSAKFASSFYGPFRDAAKSAPAFGDRRCYQLPPGARGLAMRAVDRDVQEGADMLMVKPGMPYLDIVRDTKNKYPDLPLAIYQILAANGYASKVAVLSYRQFLFLLGADIIITYFVPQLLDWLQE
ncbi:predicted protein [Nematostella vectensis]|uniref:Delta-aminolevulinic acid dehydratase n=1 Tax=Nematostella vectensis TaxID=45351 RepID=A7SKC3_NEMVE|nr:predicted protein [Nematostella vectensis]|eukprot:XP_001627874.1 predicted protein [Nematostella vectensis]